MYFKFECPSCGKNLRVREELVGRRCGCPYCAATLTVPPPPAPEAPPQASQDMAAISNLKSSVARTPGPSKGSASGALSVGTDVGMIRSGLVGLAMAAGFLAVVFPLYQMNWYLGELFFARGWVPFALLFLFGWSLAILVLKSRKLAQQRAAMLFDLFPDESTDISLDTLDKFTSHIQTLPVASQSSFLINRVIRGLEHFRVRNSASEVSTVLASQSEIDANAVDSSYTLMKVFIWAIPILGFIGTVIGISAAVGSFSGALGEASDMAVLKESLNEVTSGLATAFDTTLIALVMSILVMFPTSSMQKAEEDMLNWVDEYCNENLLKRLDDGGAEKPSSSLSTNQGLESAINRAMASHHVELQTWAKKLETIGATLTQQVVDGWSDLNEQATADLKKRESAATDLQQTTQSIENQMAAFLQQANQQQQQSGAALSETAATLQNSLVEVQRGLSGLSQVLENLGQQQVLIQQQPKKGWFGRK